MRADDLVVDKTYVRIFVWDISDGVSNPLLMFEAERIFEEQIKDEENGRRKQYATPRTLVRSSLLPHTQECGNTCWNSSGLVPQCHRIAPSRKQSTIMAPDSKVTFEQGCEVLVEREKKGEWQQRCMLQ